jgi:hypothetical protein
LLNTFSMSRRLLAVATAIVVCAALVGGEMAVSPVL